MLATITFVACFQLVGLVVLAAILAVAFAYWVNCGGFIGWWIASDMMNALGVVLSAIGEVILGMLRAD